MKMSNSLIARFSPMRSVLLKNIPNVVNRSMSSAPEDVMTHTGQVHMLMIYPHSTILNKVLVLVAGGDEPGIVHKFKVTQQAMKRAMLGVSLKDKNRNEDIRQRTKKWDRDDYRMARFMNTTKQVNPNWAVSLIAEVPPKEVTERVVWCDGGSGPEGHPRVFINLDKPGNHSCGYCGLRFVKKDQH